jgi:hypothetical protein
VVRGLPRGRLYAGHGQVPSLAEQDLYNLVCRSGIRRSGDMAKETQSTLQDDRANLLHAGAPKNLGIGHKVVPLDPKYTALALHIERFQFFSSQTVGGSKGVE